MKTYIKQIIGLILTIIPPIAIIVCAVYFNTDKYLINSYYQFAINNYVGIDSYKLETKSLLDNSLAVYLFEDGKYYKVNNYEKILKKYKGDTLEDFKIYSNIIEFGGNYYTLPYNTNNIEGYMGVYNYEKIENSFNKKTFKITSYFCDTSDIDVECSIEDNIDVYTVETQFSVERKGLTWQITKFNMPKADESMISSDDEEEPEINLDEYDDLSYEDWDDSSYKALTYDDFEHESYSEDEDEDDE